MKNKKKRIAGLLVTALCFLLFSCEERGAVKKEMQIALLVNYGSIDDKSFNQMTWEGIKKWAKEHQLSRKNYVYQSTQGTTETATLNLANIADRHPDIIIAPGFNFTEAINIVAGKYPKQKFLLIDSVSTVESNVVSATFSNNEGSFLAGVAAALKAQEMSCSKLGFIGGLDHEVIHEFEAGFEAGVKAVDPALQVLPEYVDDFANPDKGKRVASRMYGEGAGIIFNVAGSTGIGIIEEARKRATAGEDVFVVGVDRDQYEDGIYDGGKSVILTSMLKKVDMVAYNVLSQVENGDFKGGHVRYGLKEAGVGLPENNPNLQAAWIRIIKTYEQAIISGKITVPEVPERIRSRETKG